jgi:PKD repeat protein
MRIRIPLLLLLLAALLALPSSADASVSCPNPNPVVNENNCMGPGSSAWQLTNYEPDGITGYATATSVNLGQSVTLRIAVPSGTGNAEVNVFRMGWYGGAGGRLVYQAKKVAITNDRECEEPDTTTGYWSCANWENSMTIPGSSLPASGIYIARIKDLSNGEDNQIIFTVRNDSRHSELLYKLPIATYQAYNYFNGHSLYRFNSAGFNTITGTARAVKVSFERPFVNDYNDANWFLKADFPMVAWMEKEGYDVDYTDNVSVDSNPGQLLNHKTLVISGHDEYWSEAEMNGYKAAREAGVNIASFSGNTAYWKVRYENGGRTLVCYKAVEGTKEGSVPDGSKGVNDWGPDGIKGTKDDAVGADGIAGTKDDNPQYATTTWRDNGAPPGNPNAPPEGRVGPDDPENSLLGSMYVGDNDNFDYPLTIPAANAEGEYAGDRIWRHTGISETQSTTIGSGLNGWEWDSIPTQAQYTKFEPSGVKRVSLSDVGTAPSPPEWIQDEGLLYSSTPPPGQPSSVSAVRYTAPSGAQVFAAGTIQWSWGLAPHYLDKPSESYEDPPVDDSDPRIQQATYNILADGGVQPLTPTGVVIDGNEPPQASFTATPNPTSTGTTVTFDASGAKDPDGSIVKYEWDLDGNGTYETNTGSTPTVTDTYAQAEEVPVHLRVTDNGGATDQTVRTVVVSSGKPGNIAPKAAFSISPNPASLGTQVSFDASSSFDPNGSIVKYEWDLDGNGTYETNTGSNPVATRSYSSEGDLQVSLRVTDNEEGTDIITHPLIVGQGSAYHSEVFATPGLIDYWRMGDKTGNTLANETGGSPATAQGGFTLGTPGALAGDLDTATSFDGSTGAASAPLDLSGSSQLTLEFWLNWSAYANDDNLAFEFTPNFNNTKGGFLVDPNAGELGGKFGIGIGVNESRNNAYFARPSAGVWHHYALVFNTQAPASEQIIPYVDGQPVPYEKLNSGTGAGNFANSVLYFMSRNAASLFGKGSLDEVALYKRALSATEIQAHYQASRADKPPVASFNTTPNPAPVEAQVSFDASGSKDADGSIVKYEWDLDGNGTYETNTGSSPVATTSYTTEGTRQVGLRVTDNEGAVATATRTVTVESHLPQARFTTSPNPVSTGALVSFDGSSSSENGGSIVKYEWDLDGNGTYETNTGSTPSATKAYAEAGDYKVGLRVTDSAGKTATTTHTVTVAGAYSSLIDSTPGLIDYWRLGEAAGNTLADIVGGKTANLKGGVTLGAPGALENDPNTAASFDGSSAAASAPLDLSGSSQLTLEFWLNWSAYANDDHLAFEFTPNFNENSGGFLVDPNAGELGGKFGVGIGSGESRNNAYFNRPSAGAWHHYALVFNTQAPASEQVIPYVDGQPVPYEKTNSGTGAGNFANSALYFMSRNASTLFGKGSLDEVALYKRALSAAEVKSHFLARGGNKAPTAAIAASPNPAQTNAPVTFDASGSSDPDGSVVKYEWDLDGNGTYETNTGSTPTVSQSYTAPGERTVGVKVTDNQGAVGTATVGVRVQDQPPLPSFSATPNPASTGTPIAFDASGSKDPDGSVVKYEWDLDGNGTYETNTGSTPTVKQSYPTPGERTIGLRVTDNNGETTTTSRTVNVVGGYYEAVASTPGLIDYWRLGEASGSTLVDGVEAHNATAQGGYSLGTPGALAGDPNTAASFDGGSGAASAPLDLSGSSQLTVEFWLNWSAYNSDDHLAFEFTPNFNENSGGFLVDPNAGELGGKFGVAIGSGESRNNAYFARPSAGVWHHYALVFNTQASASEQVIPYVDGQPVSYEKLSSGTGAGNFAKSTLYFMSRNASTLFGKGSLDEVAIYNRALSATEVATHFEASVDKPPVASFTASPNPVAAGIQTTFDASGSKDPDGSVVKYEWDLDGNGTYETNTGSTPTVSQSYSTAGEIPVGLRVTDNGGETATTTRTLTVRGSLPTASFTATPNPVPTGTQVSFDASGSSDAEGPIAKYEWDLDGNGTYETNTGSTPTVSQSYAANGSVKVGLRVTDGDGATATSATEVTVQNRPPVASFSATPNPAPTGTPVTFDASSSNDPDGSIVKYEWDLDGNGTYETDTGSTPSASKTYATPGETTVGLRVTDDDGATETTSRTVVAQNRSPVASFTATPNPVSTQAPVSFDASGSSDPDGSVVKYEWDLDGNGTYETNTGTTPTVSNTYASAGKVAVGLRVTDDKGATAVTSVGVTVQNQAPTASFSSTPNPVVSGGSVSFDASASKDPDGTVVKYEWDLDGNGTYETNTGTTPTTSKTYATPGEPTVGLRVTDNEGSTATTTRALTVQNRNPVASFTATPNPVPTGTAVSFNASGSADPDGTVVKYEWDLDGNGTYETNTGATPTTTKTYATPGEPAVGLRVTDNSGGTATTTKTLTVQNRAPVASFTAAPNPVPTGTAVSFNASGSADPDGTVVKYEWDLDGNGTYETNTGATPTTSKTYATAANVTVGLRVTDNSGATGTTTKVVTVRSAYNAAVLATSGLIDYWRLGETSGTTFADSVGGHTATAQGGVTLGGTGALANDSDGAPSFDGVNDAASAALNLSGTSQLTVEFWLKWSNYASNDDLALEFTPNSTNNSGGFFIDPNAGELGGRFGVGIGRLTSRNTAYFTRPSANTWHHYVFVFDSKAGSTQQVIPYVDGQPVSYTKLNIGIGAGNFANSTLYFMSRGTTSLFGKGNLDELAIYNRALTAAEISAHFKAASQ